MRSPGFRRGNFARLGGLVNKSLDQMGLRHRILEYQVMGKWKQVVGPHIAAATVAERVQDGILFICCKSSAWANECTLHKQHIITELNRAAGRKVITDIRFSSKGYKRALEAALASQRPAVPKDDIESVQLDPEASALADRAAANAPSPELAKRIQHAILTGKRMEKTRLSEGWRKCSTCNNLHRGKSEICDDCRAEMTKGRG